MDPIFKKQIDGLSQRIWLVLFARSAIGLAIGYIFLWGAVVLILRSAVGLDRGPLMIGLPGLVPIFAIAAILTLRAMPPRAAITAAIDRRNACGGLVMAAEEARLYDWRDHIAKTKTVTVPQVQWHYRKSCGLLALAMAFVAVCFALPKRFVEMARAETLEIGRQVEQFTEQIEILRQERLIDGETAKDLAEKLGRLRQDASGQDPIKTFESLDHLEETLRKVAQEATEESLSQTEQLTRAEMAAGALGQIADELDAKTLAEAMSEMADMLENIAAENNFLNEKLGEKLAEKLLEAIKNGAISKEDLAKIAGALASGKADLAEMLKKLSAAGLIDPEKLKLAEKLGCADAAGLAQFLKENAGSMSHGEMIGRYCCGNCSGCGGSCSGSGNGTCRCPGRGGISRGRGDAPMTFAGASSEIGAEFQEQSLPPASVGSLLDSTLAGVNLDAPVIDTTTAGPVDSVLGSVAPDAGSAYTHTVLPRHRGPVERFFQRD